MVLYSYPLHKLAEEFQLVPVYRSTDYDSVQITVSDISKPGMQMAGFFDHFEPMRLQAFGTVESTYVYQMTPKKRREVFDRFFSYREPALVVARNLEITPECLEAAKKYDVSVLRSSENTSWLVSAMMYSLSLELAPRVTRHGVLVEVYGEGILLTGDSGIGKSEAAIELVKRGHRLVADDAVEIRKISNTRVSGTAPESIRHYVELRGIGIINVARLFGMGAVRDRKDIDLVVNLQPWDQCDNLDRIGLEQSYVDILGVQVPTITVPITPGRNIAVIVETAAMNNRQKSMGYNAAEEFTAQLSKTFTTGAL